MDWKKNSFETILLKPIDAELQEIDRLSFFVKNPFKIFPPFNRFFLALNFELGSSVRITTVWMTAYRIISDIIMCCLNCNCSNCHFYFMDFRPVQKFNFINE
jgi:hypothetical protein